MSPDSERESAVTLEDAVSRLDSLSDSDTIYVDDRALVTGSSLVVVCEQPEDGTNPPAAARMEYLLEVYLAKEAVDVWCQWRPGRVPSVADKVQAIIHYSIRDAYLPV